MPPGIIPVVLNLSPGISCQLFHLIPESIYSASRKHITHLHRIILSVNPQMKHTVCICLNFENKSFCRYITGTHPFSGCSRLIGCHRKIAAAFILLYQILSKIIPAFFNAQKLSLCLQTSCPFLQPLILVNPSIRSPS